MDFGKVKYEIVRPLKMVYIFNLYPNGDSAVISLSTSNQQMKKIARMICERNNVFWLFKTRTVRRQLDILRVIAAI